MGPKKAKDAGPSSKTVNKAKEKLIEDKTFGLKNKNKSKQVQKYISGVETQVKSGGNSKVRLKTLHRHDQLTNTNLFTMFVGRCTSSGVS